MSEHENCIPWLLSTTPPLSDAQRSDYEQQALEILTQMEAAGLLGDNDRFELDFKDAIVTCTRMDNPKGKA